MTLGKFIVRFKGVKKSFKSAISPLSHAPNIPTAIAEAMEPRLLFSADLTAATLATASGTESVQQQSNFQASVQVSPSQLFVIDLRIANVQQLLEGLEVKQADARAKGEQFDILLLDANDDGIAKTSEALSRRGLTSELHLLGHGSDGMMLLGNTWLDAATIRSRSAEYCDWSLGLSNDADILLYGCDFASSDIGKVTAQSLAELTGADVAASIDTTSNNNQLGNLNLEFQSGEISSTTQAVKDAAALRSWGDSLVTYVVSNANDSGVGSLREAINLANANVGADLITFNIAGAGPHSINLLSALPSIVDRLNIDGTTQSGFSSAPLIELNGASAGLSDGIQLFAGSGGSGVYGLVINAFSGVGINITSDNNLIESNYIGTSSDGTVARANLGMGIYVGNATGNLIGGSLPVHRNVISGNLNAGIFIDGVGSNSNSVMGNFIGTNASGLGAIGNGDGIVIAGGSSYNLIGGLGVGEGNLVSGNTGSGIGLYSTHHNLIRGNIVGLNVSGNSALGNAQSGVSVVDSSSDAIGGAGIGEGNTISGNLENGIFIADSTGLSIQGNLIGRNLGNTASIGNTFAGVFLRGTTTGTLIGGTPIGAANVIAGNLTGITTDVGASAGNAFLGNRIYANTELGIDLNDDGITINDPLDIDTGSNDQQNFPLLYAANSANGNLFIDGELNSHPNTNYRIEFFSSATGNSVGYGDGPIYLGSISVSTNAAGDAYYSVALTGVTVPANRRVTATATVDLGGGNFGSTSEFSRNIVTTADTPGVNITPPAVPVTTEASGTASFSVTLNSAPSSDVTISLSVSDLSEGAISVGSLTFTALNWSIAQVVTVTGVDDFLLDGAVNYRVVTSAANSADSSYNGIDVVDVFFTTPDNDIYNTAVVDTTYDLSDGDTSSLAALYANRGADGKISLREAIMATNNTVAPTSTVNHIHFDIQEPLVAGEHVITIGSSLPIVSRSTVIDATTDSDWLFNGQRPVVVLDGNDLSASGIEFSSTGGDSTVRGFVIRNFSGNAILITTGADRVTIAGNYIGSLNSSGADLGVAFSNSFSGLYIDSGNNLIGGASVNDRNVISGNQASSIIINASSGNTIQNNFIGTDASGLTLVGTSSGNGVLLLNGSSNNQIGTAGYGNVIGGQLNGIAIRGAGSSFNKVQGNYIGTDLGSSVDIGNIQEGVEVFIGANDNLIGGVNFGEGNTIFNNGAGGFAGVSIEDTSTGNSILGNRIANNGAIGIQLGWGSFVPLPNDVGDLDGGGNDQLNFPVLTSAVSTAGSTSILGSFNSIANQSFRVEFFSSASGDALGYGEGRSFIGFATVTTDAAGNAPIFAVLTGPTIPSGFVLSATATVDLGSGIYGSTSEFSQNVVVSSFLPGGVTVTPPLLNSTPEYGGTVQFSVVLDTQPSSDVTINLAVSDATEGSLSTSSLTFTSLNWNTAQTAVVTGVRDFIVDGDINYSVITSLTSSADPAYDGLNVADIALVTPDYSSFNSVVVSTTSDVGDGDTSSIEALYANRGADGKISLREAILAANATVNPPGVADRIFFDIPDDRVAGLHTISLSAALPVVTDAVYIDGTTEPNYVDAPVVRIDNAASVGNGITFANGSAGSGLDGLMITGFANAGVLVETGSDSTLLARNYIGTDGVNGLGNGFGVIVRSDINFIGNVGTGNLISGNLQSGIQFQNGANSNFVIGNKIGTNLLGTLAISNGSNGIEIVAGANNNVIGDHSALGGNVISGNSQHGVLVSAAQGTLIRNNLIGLDAAGNTRLGNSVHGVLILNGATGTIVGGSTSAERNVISGNRFHGVNISGSTTSNNFILGNYIGINSAGSISVGNGWSGVSIDGNAKNNTVGGAGSGEGNVIAGGTGNGITLASNNTVGNRILGNFIGTNSAGSSIIGNALIGIEAVSSSGANSIGGVLAGEGNVIAHNSLEGVSITSGLGFSILGNRIYSNGSLGIDLNEDGVTANDVLLGDADVGPNSLLNYPVFFSAEMLTGGYINVGFSLDVPQLNSYRIEFFSSPAGAGDITLHGEARRYLGFRDVTVPASATAYQVLHTFIPDFPVVAGDLITATATLKTGSSTFSSTSEFSQNIALQPLLTSSISGRVFDDTNAIGDAASSAGLAGVKLLLYLDDGDATANAADTFIGSVSTDSGGNYAFTNLSAGRYWTVVDSRSVNAPLNASADSNSVWWDQTYGADGSKTYNGSVTYTTSSGLLLGGASRDSSDSFDGSAASLVGAEHMVRTTLGSGVAETEVDFGFSSQLVVTTLDSDDDASQARSKQGSLRQFIQNSNALVGVQTSLFRLATTDVNYDGTTGTWRISIANALPTVIDGGRLNGYSQSIWGGDTNPGSYLPSTDPLRPFAVSPIDRPEIELVSSNLGNFAPGISLSGSGGQVSGLAIFGFDTGIFSNAVGSIIYSNFIGADAQGLDPLNRRLDTGIRLDGSVNSTIRDNFVAFIELNGLSLSNSVGVLIESNTIFRTGLDDSQYDGINIAEGNGGIAITGNSILSSNAFAIDAAEANGLAITRNFIADSGLGGVELGGIFVRASVQTATIQSNVITRSHDAISLMGNGILNTHQIGGVGLGNTLVANQGVGILLTSSNGVRIQGNLIGLTSTLVPMANLGAGISAANTASVTLIGGANAGEGNVIANSSSADASGILLLGNGYQTTILGNSIYQNRALGISQGVNANTPALNDLNDADLTALSGPQNHPVLTSVQIVGAATLVNGALNTKAGRNYRIEVFRNPATLIEPSGISQGAEYLGYFNVSTDALGQALFSQSITAATAVGDKITLTATEDMGAGFAATSEFSGSVAVSSTMPSIVIDGLSSTTTSELGASTTFLVRLSTAPVSDVTINLSSSDTSEGTLSVSSLVFTSLNWNVAQVVSVRGVDDTFIDGNKAYSISFAAAISSDPAYSGLVAGSGPLMLSNTDDDDINLIVVDTTSDDADGDTSSVEALQNNKGTDGRVSLREAIIAANNTSNGIGGADQILFSIGSSAQSINLSTALPTITDTVTIDATTQTGFMGLPLIELVGNSASFASGLRLMPGSDGSTIRGLIVNNFALHGIEVLSNLNVIAGNYIGTNASGTAAIANRLSGLSIAGANNTIGGYGAIDRNVISGNASNGIIFYGDPANGNRVIGNYIGLSASGDTAIANIGEGVIVVAGSHSNIIGVAGAGNVISGNTGNGLGFNNSYSNWVQGNIIGLNAAGTAAIGNTYSGISIGDSNDNFIGGPTFGEGNVISGNLQNGVFLSNVTSQIIQGNLIGRNAGNTANIGNAGVGLYFGGASINNLAGGEGVGQGNVIAGNAVGVATSSDAAISVSILGNQIFQNSGLGVDLEWNGVTANDLGDVDTGPNTLLNFPVLISAVSSSGSLNVAGSFNGPANATLRIEFFGSRTGLVTDHGQAQTYLGFTNIATDALGNATFYATIPVASSAVGSVVSATATLVIANGVYGSTSEFAKNVLVASAPPGITVSPPIIATTTEAGASSQFSVILNSPPSADVVITLVASDLSEASLSTNTLVFTMLNWNIAQVVTVVGQDDFFVDGNTVYSVITSTASSADLAYDGLQVADVSLSNIDNDTFNTLIVDTTADATDGDTSSIAALYANTGADGKVSLREAILASNNTVNGSQRDRILFNITDPLILGAHTINVLSALPTVTDALQIDGASEPDFGGLPLVVLNGSLAGPNVDGIRISANDSLLSGLNIDGFNGFGLILSGVNTAVIDNEISNNSQGGILINGVQNTVSNNVFGNEGVGVLIVGSAEGNTVSRNQMSNVGVLIDINNDGVSVNDIDDADMGPNSLQNTPVLTSLVLEAGGQIRLQGSYNGEPSKTLVIELYEHGTVGTSSRSQFVASFVITTDLSGNAAFNQLVPSALGVGTIFSATATDISLPSNQSTSEHSAVIVSRILSPIAPEVLVSLTSPLFVNEAGASVAVSVMLSTAPTADVTINFSANIAGEVALSSSSFTFTVANWNVAQVLTISGVQDFISDGDTLVSIVTSNAVSADVDYAGLEVIDISVTNQAIANVAPIILAPLSYATTEDTVSSLGATSSGLRITDVDAGNNLLSVTLAVTNGVYSLGSTAGLNFLNGDGSADASMTFTGTVVQINAAIDSITFIANANFSGVAELSITVNDLGNTGSGGVLGTTSTVPVNVIAVNDSANFSGSRTAIVTEGGRTIITSSMLQLTDVDTPATDLVFSVASQSMDGDLRRAGVLLRTGDSFTQADIDAGLIDYLHLGGEAASSSIMLSMTEQFGANLPDVELMIGVAAVNDAPSITDLSGATVAEGAALGTVIGTVAAIDADNSTGAQFSLADIDSGAFDIDSTTGAIFVANSLLLDFENAQVQSVRVKVTDVFGASAERVFQIQVTDVTEFGPVLPPTVIPPTVPPITPPGVPPTVIFPAVTSNGSPVSGLPTITAETNNSRPGSPTGGFNSSTAVVVPPEVRTGSANSPKQRQAEIAGSIWIDAVQESRTSARKDVARRFLNSVELELLDADGFVKRRRSMSADSLDELFKVRKAANASFVPPTVLIYDFKMPTDAKTGLIDETSIETVENAKRFNVVVDSVEVGGVILSVGVVAWVTRAGGLLAALMSALPAWKGLDPLLVLSPSKAKAGQDLEDFSDTEVREDEEAVRAVLS
jgi:hypothetical protein